MEYVVVTLMSLVAGWIVNLAADNVPERDPFFQNWYLPLFRLPKWLQIGLRPVLRPLVGSSSVALAEAEEQRPTMRTSIVWLGAILLGWLTYFHSGPTITTAAMALYAWFFLAIAAIDLEHRKVYNRMLLAATPVMLLFTPFIEGPTVWSALGGGLFGFGLFLVLALAWPGAMGMGDVKLAGVIGLVTGFPGIIVAILICIFSGGFVATLVLLRSRFKRGQTIAYAPYLVLGAWISLYYGTEIWTAYMSMQ